MFAFYNEFEALANKFILRRRTSIDLHGHINNKSSSEQKKDLHGDISVFRRRLFLLFGFFMISMCPDHFYTHRFYIAAILSNMLINIMEHFCNATCQQTFRYWAITGWLTNHKG